MPTAGGPNTLGESNLVFAYDTGDVRNSYIGEPTTNLALFTIASSTFSTDTPSNLTQTSNSTEATYQGRLSRKMVIGSGYWNCYIYNYNTSNSNTDYTISFKVKAADGSHPSTFIGGGYIYGSAGNFFLTPSFTPIDNGWYLVYIKYSGSAMTLNSLTGVNGSGGPKTFYIVDYQAEAKNHPTPFTSTNTTRSATQGLLPLIGNSTIDLSNVSFDANAQMVFDGTNDYIAAGNPTSYRMGTNDFTLECVMKQSKTTGHCLLETRGDSLVGYLWVHNYYSTGQSCLFLNYGGNQYLYFQDGGFTATTTTQYYHMAVVVNRAGSTVSFYVNGNKAGNSIAIHNNSISPSGGDLYYVGYDKGGSPWQGEIPVFKHYNKALTAQEIKQNYQQYKTRFNLS